MSRDLGGGFECASVFKEDSDSGVSEGVAADSGGDSRFHRAALDHAEDIDAGHAFGGDFVAATSGAAPERVGPTKISRRGGRKVSRVSAWCGV